MSVPPQRDVEEHLGKPVEESAFERPTEDGQEPESCGKRVFGVRQGFFVVFGQDNSEQVVEIGDSVEQDVLGEVEARLKTGRQ